MAVDNVQVNTSTGVDGNAYTSSVSNDELTNDDFLKLMIQELKLQDPTKPMDSKQMLASQMQMSTISTNQEMVKAMASLQTSYAQTALSNAANVIGKNVEDGNIGENGITKAYTVRSVETVDGQVQVKAQQILYYEDRVKLTAADDESSDTLVNYNVKGEILDNDGNVTDNKIVLQEPGLPLVRDGKLVILDKNNEEITDHKYELAGATTPVFSDQLTSIPFSNLTKIF
ncbi:flagellar hook assembly protein FlgD [Arcobacter roscoffensis]|uniref:Basal-body rod modification protein FlgD n=1 Tax=Arcobacter roscoffensis TaxID=2961520 RepID=A0ABY5E4C6_9BACT|nr:flagellar hook capping FlgD N-terminal domain-containing protein [Arcobacter roscoffensis]UTJ05983.1 flagellar biosynthesis protein FlgD [Arcobacter roscoffensis]